LAFSVNRIVGLLLNAALSPLRLRLVRVNSHLEVYKQAEQDAKFSSGVDRNTARLIFHYSKYFETKDLAGVIVEAGVGAGGGLGFFLKLRNHFGDYRTIWAFDSFAGFPNGSNEDSKAFREFGKPGYEQFTLSYVKAYLSSIGISTSEISKIKFIEGFIPESLKSFDEEKVALLNCDLDLYQSIKDTLFFFWPKMVPGGIILLDEYDSRTDLVKWPGAKKAVDEFCAISSVKVQRGFGNRPFLRKD